MRFRGDQFLVGRRSLVTLSPSPASRDSPSTANVKSGWDCFVWAIDGREKFSVAPCPDVTIPDEFLGLIQRVIEQAKLLFVFNPDALPVPKTAGVAVIQLSRYAQSMAKGDVASSYFEMAASLAMLIDEHEARDCLRRSIASNRLNTNAARLLAFLHRRQGKDEAAARVLGQLLMELEGLKVVAQRELDALPGQWARDDDRVAKVDRDIRLATADLRRGLH